MPTLVTDAERNLEATAAAARITHVALHTTTPGLTGAAECVGGAPAYARKVPTFTAGGVQGILGAILQPATVGIAWSDTMTFDLPVGTYGFWGGWDALVAGNYLRGNTLSSAQELLAQGQLNLSIGIGPYAGA